MGGRGVLTPYTGEYSDFRSVDGVLVPFRLSAIWHLEEGPFPYARWKVESVELAPVVLTWTYAPAGQAGFRIQRATNPTFTAGLVTFNVGDVRTLLRLLGEAADDLAATASRRRTFLGPGAWSNSRSIAR